MNQPEIIKPEHYDDDDEGRVVDNADLGALVALNSSEINQQILTAHAYPRSLTTFRRQIKEMATLDREVAQSCLYSLKRGNKVIADGLTREDAIDCAGDNHKRGARVWNAQTGDEVINGHDGKIREV